MSDVRPLRDEADYDAALKAIEAYFNQAPEPGTPEADAFDRITLVIADYEALHWPFDPPNPPEKPRAAFSQVALRQSRK